MDFYENRGYKSRARRWLKPNSMLYIFLFLILHILCLQEPPTSALKKKKKKKLPKAIYQKKSFLIILYN